MKWSSIIISDHQSKSITPSLKKLTEVMQNARAETKQMTEKIKQSQATLSKEITPKTIEVVNSVLKEFPDVDFRIDSSNPSSYVQTSEQHSANIKSSEIIHEDDLSDFLANFKKK